VKTSQRRLAQAAKPFTAKGLPVEAEVSIGEPALEIVRLAAVQKIDLLVMGSHTVKPGRGARGWGHDQLQGRAHLPVPHPPGEMMLEAVLRT
jgi:nucleotide-binding universal stress UspA family protein